MSERESIEPDEEPNESAWNEEAVEGQLDELDELDEDDEDAGDEQE